MGDGSFKSNKKTKKVLLYLQEIYHRTYVKSIYYIFHIQIIRIVAIEYEIIISIKIGVKFNEWKEHYFM